MKSPFFVDAQLFLRRSVSLLLIFFLTIDPSIAQSSQPARIIELTPAQLQALAQKVSAPTVTIAQSSDRPVDDVKKKVEEEEKKKKKEPVSGDLALNGALEGVSSGGNNDAALVVFAVVGLVIIIAWIPYFPLLAYDAITGRKDLTIHHQFGIRYDRLTRKDRREGGFTHGRYSLFLEDKMKDDFFVPGFSVEAGHYLLKYDNPALRLEGGYALAGPSLALGDINSFAVKFDLLGGTSFDTDLGLMSKADISFNFKLPSNLTFGLNFGGVYLDVKSNEGALSRPNDLGFFYGANLGFSF